MNELFEAVQKEIKPLEDRIEKSTREFYDRAREFAKNATDKEWHDRFPCDWQPPKEVKMWDGEVKMYYTKTKKLYNSVEYKMYSRGWISDYKNNKEYGEAREAEYRVFVEKEVKFNIEKNHAKILKAFVKINSKLGITEVLGSTLGFANQGIEGVIDVMTGEGQRVLDFHSILAGGYNIQILHYRYLCKVRK